MAFIEKGKLVRQDTLETITQRSHRLTYVFSDGLFPLAQLNAVLPEVRWELADHRATATFPAKYRTEELNAAVLRVLLEAGVGVLEIHRGSDLESEYLRIAHS